MKNLYLQIITRFVLGLCILFISFEVRSQESESYYIDLKSPEELHRFLSYSGVGKAFLSAHRGGPEDDKPENCIRTFGNTLQHTFAIMEVDPRYTKDSVIILFHDPVLDRTTTGSGLVNDYTYRQIQQFKLKDLHGNPTRDTIPTLAAALNWANGKTILLLDKKDVPIEKRLEIVEQCKAVDHTIIMAYNNEEAKKCYSLNPDVMMQIFMNSVEKVKEFDQTHVPWENVVVFTGHNPPDNPVLIQMLHERGVLCIAGTSRNLDRLYSSGKVTEIEQLKDEYERLIDFGIDIIETDIPVELSKIIPSAIINKNH